ncbi:DUF2147 domain-containing protein [Brumimicrobium salinarum]|uniref:DUF2147 domain-containing protein n=1 Tax=Brumimicrobium salinarum TaxID=2058658 RepID=A0A2I0R200_9FLAO|nr:DUF2147 domain-containing protein [Brumimicrobium salinarum]PKR80611.1 DUF2147 domain-containing protein [Brumimicrobium salinarum]
MNNALLILMLSFFSFVSHTQTVEGIWQTFSESGELQSDVKLYVKNGKLYGKMLKFYNSKANQNDKKCLKCKGERKNQPLVGLTFMNGLSKSGDEWEGDEVLLDPENGKEYDGKIWLINENKLAMRGYLGWLYETQYWKRKQ